VLITASCRIASEEEAMQATSKSEKAVELYNSAYQIAYGVLELNKAITVCEQAIKEDPNFFMAYYQLATYHLFHQDDDEFIKTAESAIGCDIKLSKGEIVQKSILETWLNNRNGDASELGKELIKLYPNDPDSYLNLGFIYYINKDYLRAIEVFEKSISMDDIGESYCGPKLAIVPICMLGYSYLVSNQPEMYRSFVSNLCKNFQVNAYTIDYRLILEHPYPAALNDAFSTYKWLLEEESLSAKKYLFLEIQQEVV
jgi:tetratricopeptide (TPR) repeat protein